MSKVVGIITEYNPLHNGHIEHIKKTLEISKADLLVCVMSPNYVMRGDLAVSDKFSRSEVALMYGVDIVLELPINYTLQSSENFAYGSVKTLNLFGVEEIYFGSESNDINTLYKIKEYIKSDIFKTKLKENMKLGLSYTKSFQISLKELFNIEYKSNDILGVNYLEAIDKINKKIKAYTIKREFSNYNDKTANHSNIASATAIRNMSDKSNYIPNEMLKKLNNKSLKDYYDVIRNKIITEDLSNIHLVSEGLDVHLKKHSHIEKYDDFLDKVTNKRYTSSRITRVLLSILLSVTKDEINSLPELNYFRILKMNDKAKSFINKNKKNYENINIVTKYKDYPASYKHLVEKASKVYGYEYFLQDLKNIPYKKEKKND